MARRQVRVATLALLALAVTGCSVFPSPEPSPRPGEAVPLLTQPSPQPGEACAAGRIGGVLTADPTYGLGLSSDGAVRGVIWPHGYSARHEPGGIVLIDRLGQIVAREGDRIVMGGFMSDDHVNHPCYSPNLEVVE